MEMQESDWSGLPNDLLDLLLTRLDLVPDHCRFGGVCLSWRSAAVDNRCRNVPLNQFPGLLMRNPVENTCGCPRKVIIKTIRFSSDDDVHVPEDPDVVCGCRKNIRYFVQLNYKTGFFQDSSSINGDVGQQQQRKRRLLEEVPYGQSNVCAGSAYGWLFLTDIDLSIKLLNPFSGAEIQLPSADTLPIPLKDDDSQGDIDKWDVRKAVFSSNPSFQHVHPPIIVVIYIGHTTPRLAFCKPGDKAWKPLPSPTDIEPFFSDVIFYNDQLYALSNTNWPCIVAYSISLIDSSLKLTLVASWPSAPSVFQGTDLLYVVELDKELVVVVQHEGCDADVARHAQIDEHEAALTRVSKTHGNASRTIRFHIFKVEVGKDVEWTEVKSLGDNAMFLGLNTSYCLKASDHPGCIPNSIYFTDGYAEAFVDTGEDYVGYDMGIYRLDSKRVEPLHNVDAPSTCWLTYFPPW